MENLDFKYRRPQPSPLAPLQNRIAPPTVQVAGVSVSGSYGSKGQFFHGKENLRPTCFTVKNKFEVHTCKSTTNASSCIPRRKALSVHQFMAPAVTAAAALASSPKPINTSKTQGTVISCKDWSPEDDGIEIILSPTKITSSKEDVVASSTALSNLVYGPTKRRRLPLFAEICPE